MKAERDAIECELKSATVDMKDAFLAALHDGSVNEQALSVETLGRAYGPLQQQVKESLAKQEGLMANIQVHICLAVYFYFCFTSCKTTYIT